MNRLYAIVCCLLIASCNFNENNKQTTTDIISTPSKVEKPKKVEKKDTVVKEKPIDTASISSDDMGLSYHFEHKSIWKSKEGFEGRKYLSLLAALNRVDQSHLKSLDSFIVPNHYSDSLADYLPFPKEMPYLSDVDKIIIFSYPTQTFAAYEYGKLFLTGPTNMGKKSTPTPTGLFFCNWKSKEATSTVDKTWKLKWNFNISNYGGVGFHQYSLPGYPASHSCLRLWGSQAETLYYWASQWRLKGNTLLSKGTPVVVYGKYPFGKTRPWYKLPKDSKLLNISSSELESIIAPYKEEILKEQANRIQVQQGEQPDNTQKVDTTKRTVGA